MTYLLDTVTCIAVLRQRPGMVARLSQVSPSECAVSAVTVYELFCGVEKAQTPSIECQKVERFLSVIAELPFLTVPRPKRRRASGRTRRERGRPSAPTTCSSQVTRS